MVTHRGLHFLVLCITSAPIEGEPPKPTNVEDLIEEEHARDVVDTLYVVRRVGPYALMG